MFKIKRQTRTHPRRIQRPHIKHINPLHLPQNLQSLQPRRLLKIGRDSTWQRTGGDEVFGRFDFCLVTRLKRIC